ncbi:unnamed protein product [Rhizopus stolonifer]
MKNVNDDKSGTAKSNGSFNYNVYHRVWLWIFQRQKLLVINSSQCLKQQRFIQLQCLLKLIILSNVSMMRLYRYKNYEKHCYRHGFNENFDLIASHDIGLPRSNNKALSGLDKFSKQPLEQDYARENSSYLSDNLACKLIVHCQ